MLLLRKNGGIKFIIILGVFVSSMNITFAQKTMKIEDSLQLKRFHEYIDYIINFEKDTAVTFYAHTKYRILYQTVCPYTVFGSTEININDVKGICRENPVIVDDTITYRMVKQTTTTADDGENDSLVTDKRISGMNEYKYNSYNLSRFLIITRSYILNAGDYTSTGETITYFLERTD